MSNRGKIAALMASARAAGADATHVARLALYGTRRTPDTNASDAHEQRTAIGTGLQSVWKGPKKIKTGAPVLRRVKQA